MFVLWFAAHKRDDSDLWFGWKLPALWCLLTCLLTTFAQAFLFSIVVATDLTCRSLCPCLCVRVCVCVTGRWTTTMSTQSVTAQDPGGGWPSRRALGRAQDCQSQCMAQNAVSLCVNLFTVSLHWNFQHKNVICHCLDDLQPTTLQSQRPVTSEQSLVGRR